MAENKKGFVLYADLIHTVKLLEDEQAGKLFKHVLSYVNDENPLCDDIVLKLAFEPIKQHLKRDLKKYERRIKKFSDAGKRSGEVRRNKQKRTTLNDVEPSLTSRTVKDTVSVKDNVNVTVKDNIYHIEDVYEFLKEKETSEIEVFEMQQKKSFPDFSLFVKYFNNVVIKEELEWKPKVLLARLRMLNDNWDKRPKKEKNLSEKKEKVNAGELIKRKYGLG